MSSAKITQEHGENLAYTLVQSRLISGISGLVACPLQRLVKQQDQ